MMEEVMNSRVPPSSSRAMRNIAEKQRRDKLNGFINELSTLVPTVAQASRKLDKTSILRLAASYLRLYQNVPDAVRRKKENRENIESKFARTVDLLQTFDSFLVVLSVNQAKILHVTENVENLLSYSQVDMLGISFYCFVHPEDHGLFRSQILPHPVFETLGLNDSKSDQRSCCFRISTKGISRNEPVIYEKAILWGHCKVADYSSDLSGYNDGFRYPGPFRDSSRQSKSNDVVFIGVVKLLARKLPSRLTLLETLNDEYITRHALDPGARIITTDHRISTVAGYLSDEVTGKSALSFMHPDDLPAVGAALRLLFMSPEGEGIITYRLIRCDGSFIYLRTRGHVEFEPGTKTVKSLICINTLVSEEEGKKALEDAKAELAASLSPQVVPLNCSMRKASSLSVSLDVQTTISPFVPESKPLLYSHPEPSSPDSGIGASDSERCVVTDLDTGKPLELVKSAGVRDESNERCEMWSNCTEDGLRLVIRRRGRPPSHCGPYKRCK